MSATEFQNIFDDIKDKIPEGKYLELCNLNKKKHEEDEKDNVMIEMTVRETFNMFDSCEKSFSTHMTSSRIYYVTMPDNVFNVIYSKVAEDGVTELSTCALNQIKGYHDDDQVFSLYDDRKFVEYESINITVAKLVLCTKIVRMFKK